MRIRQGIIVCLLLWSALVCAAKEKTVKTVLRSWQLPLPAFVPDTLPVDTPFLNYPQRELLNEWSVSNVWNANHVSPAQSRLWFDRRHKVDDIFADAYAPYILTTNDVRFYNTTVPYSRIAYNRGFTTYHSEYEINFLFTGNLTRRTNLGTQINYLSGDGHYLNQQGKLFNGSVFGSYNGDNYSLQATVTWNSLSNFDNGGLVDVADLAGSLNAEDMPVRMQGMSGYSYISALLNHYYSITTTRERHDSVLVRNDFGENEMRDSVTTEYIPVITFAHTFETNNSVRRYVEHTADQSFYEHIWRNTAATNDSTNVLTVRNTLSVTFEEAFNRHLRFGANVYAVNECQQFLNAVGQADFITLEPGFGYRPEQLRITPLNANPDSLFRGQWTNNTFVGGSIYKRNGRWVRYAVNGDVCLLGYKLGEFHVDGHVDTDFPVGKDSMFISVRSYVRNETPTYYQQHLLTNHYRWDNDFTKTYRFYVGGEIAYPTRWVKTRLRAGFENLTNYIWYGMDGIHQHGGNIQVISADLRLDLTTPWINLENNVIWQYSSDAAIPLPDLVLYHNLYYHGRWFRRAMEAQIGADMRYHTRYKAPVLNPALAQFCVQDDVLVGNYPVLNVYASFYVKLLHLRFYAQYTHINRLFTTDHTNALIMPGYPYNPDVFRAGLAFHFYK